MSAKTPTRLLRSSKVAARARRGGKSRSARLARAAPSADQVPVRERRQGHVNRLQKKRVWRERLPDYGIDTLGSVFPSYRFVIYNVFHLLCGRARDLIGLKADSRARKVWAPFPALEGTFMGELGSANPSTRRRVKPKPPYTNGKQDPSQELLQALQAMRSGDFSVRMTGDHLGIDGKITDTFNEIVAANQRMAQQLERVGQVVGREGKTRQRVRFGLASGSWADMEGSVNTLIDDLLWPTREVTRAVAAVAQGDLLQAVKLDVDGRPLGGEFLQSATIVNTMIKQLSVFTSEVTRV